MIVRIPGLRTVSEMNARCHWAVRRRRFNDQADVVGPALNCAIRDNGLGAPPYVITMTRVGPRLLDDDNLASSFKGIRDLVAEKLGIDDGDVSAATWSYRQVKHKEYAVVVEIICL